MPREKTEDQRYGKWYHPYKVSTKFDEKVAYFSMEFAIHQGLKTYSGGLGFLAGSHMRSAFELKQNVIGVGMLWKYGYYHQSRNSDMTMDPKYIHKHYSFLEDTGLQVEVKIHENPNVKVRAYVLKPEIFGTVPMYFLSTDLEENDYLSRTITNYLYDANEVTRVSQSIVLGVGGAKIVNLLGGADIYHLNEGHGLPAFYYLRDNGFSKKNFVFTTHTPEKGGNEERNAYHLNHCGFFGRTLSNEELSKEMVNGDNINYTVSALRMAKKSNGVSKLHAKVAKNMWKNFEGVGKIIPITNAQNETFWQDSKLKEAFEQNDQVRYVERKTHLKKRLLEEVLNQTGELFHEKVLTIVWARRFAGYKRADLLLHDMARFERLVKNEKYPVQIIWAGKPYPMDFNAIGIFNRLVEFTSGFPNLAILTGYELQLSKILKKGSDIWLNTPRITREASGTSGMTAAMNGSLNLTTNDGWIPEFAKNIENAFVIPEVDYRLPIEEQDRMDSENLYNILENDVIPMYYDSPEKWTHMVFNAMNDILPEFGSNRMAKQYYKELYREEK